MVVSNRKRGNWGGLYLISFEGFPKSALPNLLDVG
jgi:hypothetical protein